MGFNVTNWLYTRQPFKKLHGCQHKIAYYTAAIPEPIQIYTRLPCVHIKSLFTRQQFKSQIGYIHCCREYTKTGIYTAAVKEPNRLYTLLPNVYKNRYSHGSPSRAKSTINIVAGCIDKLLSTRQPFKSQIETAALTALNGITQRGFIG